jgi:hypothetical protein
MLGHLPLGQADTLRRLLRARPPRCQRVYEARKTPRIEKSERLERVIQTGALLVGLLRLRYDSVCPADPRE